MPDLNWKGAAHSRTFHNPLDCASEETTPSDTAHGQQPRAQATCMINAEAAPRHKTNKHHAVLEPPPQCLAAVIGCEQLLVKREREQ